jgi:hypothetical protein
MTEVPPSAESLIAGPLGLELGGRPARRGEHGANTRRDYADPGGATVLGGRPAR